MRSQLTVEVKIKMGELNHDEIINLASLIKMQADKIKEDTKHEVKVLSYFTTEEGLSCKL